ncbi:MAG: UDP-N-acetylmuramate dehydrogenase [Bacteroidetes bacterium]|nr:MAG: UDP-N-acetylmuramate dehydrogenase [Bacteroidota bacterium]
MEKDKDLRFANTFGLPARAQYYASITREADLQQILDQAPDVPILLLGGGSNVLLPPSYPGLVLKNEQLGIEVVEEQQEHVIVEAGGGVNWHDLVLWSLQQGYGGLENLALIPGTVGAAPIQNIGAYGVELKDVLVELRAIELSTGQARRFTVADCQFGYRDSIFKQNNYRGKFWLSKIKLRLTKTNHRLHLDYGAIQSQLKKVGCTQPGPSDVAAAVIEIRRAKLPDWRKLGNTGSFFKNPVLKKTTLAELKQRYPNIVYYPLTDGTAKVPAGWLIEQAGWKGKRLGPVGCYAKQALVLVNHGGATQADVLRLRDQIQQDVFEMFGVKLEAEVNVILGETSN